ncbi:MAG: cytochrome P450 [Alphaproteobacteria bacterium]|nr:cytochrome P450 [Alphaproteobacteria bacterium]
MAASSDLPTGLQLTELDPGFRADPHPLLKRLRAEAPMHWDPVFGAYFMTRYNDIRAVVTDRGLLRDSDKAEEGAHFAKLLQTRPPGSPQDDNSRFILFMDDPDHTRVRTPLAKALYARVAKARGEVEAVVDRVLDRLDRKSEFDAISEIAVPVPVLVIARLLGVDEAREEEFRAWSEGLILSLHPMRTPEQTEAWGQATSAVNDYFAAEIAERRRAPRDDLISDILAAQERGTELTDEEIRGHCVGFLVAGNMTTSDLIGNGILALLQHPSELAKLRAKPELIGKAVEEILRYEPPVGQTARIADREMSAGGCPVHKGQMMITSIPAANRDPAAYSDPDCFDITRETQPHVSFGGGQHICIGAPLARLEAQVTLTKLLQRYPNLKLVQDDIRWKNTPFFHGLEELRVRA